MTTSFKITATGNRPTGFKYLWLKNVTDFNPSYHCARCLVGKYDPGFNPRMEANTWIEAKAAPGDVLYFCGVSAPFVWRNNAHLAVQATGDPADRVSLPLYTGATLEVSGARQIAFDGDVAARHYPTRGRAFLTCRNFQFGAAWFQKPQAEG